jgi:hypothetical protein
VQVQGAGACVRVCLHGKVHAAFLWDAKEGMPLRAGKKKKGSAGRNSIAAFARSARAN